MADDPMNKPNWTRFAIVFLATCAVYVVIDWIFFGEPATQRLPGMLGAALVLGYVFGLRRRWSTRFSSRG